MSDLINLYNYYNEMAEQYKNAPLVTEETTVKSRQFAILGAYVLREIERRVEE